MRARAAIYARISNDREGREAGVERQQADCLELAARLGATVAGIYVDNDISASTRSKKPRPRYKQMIADAQAGHFELILAYTSGRVTRRPREHEDLIELAEQHGITFHYVRSPSFDLNTSAGRRIARILAANDAGEAEDIQERVTRQKLEAAKLGQWKGGRRPFGYEADGVTVRHSEADELLAAARAVLAGRSINGLVKSLNERGVLTSGGKQWMGVNLCRTLTRPRNAGFMEHQGKVIGKASWPAIIPEDVWRGVCAVLGDPSRRTSPGPARRWMGSGLYRCFCGETVYAFLSGGNGRVKKLSYRCSASKHMSRIASEVDGFVADLVVERLSREDAADLLVPDAGGDVTSLLGLAATLRGRLDEAAALFASGAITASQLGTASSQLRAELAETEDQISALSRGSVLDGLAGNADVRATWDGLELDRKRAVIDRLMMVELWAANRGRRKGWKPGESYFDPASVKIHWKP